MMNEQIIPANLGHEKIDRTRLEKYRAVFLEHEAPKGFENCTKPGNGLFFEESNYKNVIIEQLIEAREMENEDWKLGKQAIDILTGKNAGGNLIAFPVVIKIYELSQNPSADLFSLFGRLIKSDDTGAAIVRAYNQFPPNTLSFGERLCVVFTVGMWNARESAPMQITYINPIWKDLTGKILFFDDSAKEKFDLNVAYIRFKLVFEKIFRIMEDEWEWQPQHWTDIQAFFRVISRLGII